MTWRCRSCFPDDTCGRTLAVGSNEMEAGTAAMAEAGLITVPSRYSPKDTADRLQADLTGKGATIFARIDHAAGAASVHMTLRPTELLIFGNPRAGTPLMQ